MKNHRIAVLPGDGIGPEVMEQGINLLEAIAPKLNLTFTMENALIGGAAIDSRGVPLPEESLQIALNADAVLLGAVGGPKWDAIDPKIRPEQGLLQIRKAMGLYANLRPVKLFDALLHASTLKPEVLEGIDVMVVRELTGGLYFGQPRLRTDTHALDTMTYTVEEIERIAHQGFKLAQARRGELCSVDKANVLATSQLWRETVERIAKDYPDVTLSHMYVDNAAMQLIRNPRQFDVLLTENMFGDILSDEASMLSGSLGMLPSASLGENNRALYEPSHGSAPDIAGQDKGNPIATLLSVSMMLKYTFGYAEAAAAVEQAVSATLDAGFRTADIAEPGTSVVGTRQMGQEIIRQTLKLFETKLTLQA